jgi:sulfonate transport system substrate-binding protein
MPPLSFRLGLLTVALALGCSRAEGEGAQSRARDVAAERPLRIGGPWTAAAAKTPKPTGPLGYALERGLAQPILARHGFRYAGFVAFGNGPPIVNALQSASIEVGILGDTPAVSGRAGGVDTRALIIDRPVGDAWLLGRRAGSDSAAGLAHQRVGLQFGSNFDKYGRGVLRDAGVLDRVELINLPIPEAFSALLRGDIAATAVPATTAATWLLKEPLPVLDRASAHHRELMGTNVTLVTSGFLAEHPTVPAALWEATRAGIIEIRRDPRSYLAFYAEATGTPPEAVAESLILEFADEPIDPAGKRSVRATLEFLLAFGTAKAPFSVDSWVVEEPRTAQGPQR